MTNLIQKLKHRYRHVVTRGEEISYFLDRVPNLWIASVQQEDCSAIFDLWGSAEQELPLFWQYLHESLEDVVLIDEIGEPKLGYLFRDWVDESWGEFSPGAMICALPILDPVIDEFEQTVGTIPNSLRAIWTRHGTLNFKDDSHLASIDVSRYDPLLWPQVFADRFLAIVNPWRSVTRCLTRETEQMEWEDNVVEYYRDDDVFVEYMSSTIDQLLVDWPYQPYVNLK